MQGAPLPAHAAFSDLETDSVDCQSTLGTVRASGTALCIASRIILCDFIWDSTFELPSFLKTGISCTQAQGWSIVS